MSKATPKGSKQCSPNGGFSDSGPWLAVGREREESMPENTHVFKHFYALCPRGPGPPLASKCTTLRNTVWKRPSVSRSWMTNTHLRLSGIPWVMEEGGQDVSCNLGGGDTHYRAHSPKALYGGLEKWGWKGQGLFPPSHVHDRALPNTRTKSYHWGGGPKRFWGVVWWYVLSSPKFSTLLCRYLISCEHLVFLQRPAPPKDQSVKIRVEARFVR